MYNGMFDEAVIDMLWSFKTHVVVFKTLGRESLPAKRTRSTSSDTIMTLSFMSHDGSRCIQYVEFIKI